jgi:hypothetical protein
MSVVILCNKPPEWLWLAVEHMSKKISDEDRNLIKKGWDQLYRDPIREEGFPVVILRNKTPEWLWLAVEHMSKKISDEDRNLIKKGWDQLYRDPMCEEGFLSRARETRAGWQEAHK